MYFLFTFLKAMLTSGLNLRVHPQPPPPGNVRKSGRQLRVRASIQTLPLIVVAYIESHFDVADGDGNTC